MKNFLLLCCAVSVIWSCSKNESPDRLNNSLKITLNVVSDITVRTYASAEENTVNAFDIFLFDAASGILEAVQRNVTASAPSPGNVAGEQKIGEITFTLTNKNNKNILAIANGAENLITLPEIAVGETVYSDMLDAVTVLDSETECPSYPFVMSGYVNGVNPDSDITVSLRRRVAKITVSNLSQEDGLEITGLQLNRVVNQAYLFRTGHPLAVDNLKYVDYDVVTVSGATTVFYVFPQPAATNDMTLTVTGKLNGVDFTQSMNVIPTKDGIPQDMEHNTHYTLKLNAEAQTISMEMTLQIVEDWADGEEISGTIVGDSDETAKLISFNGLQWMDRNLGATSADFENDWDNAIGHFYQWGRNTAFSATQTIETISGPVTAEVAEANADKFIKRMNNDWLDGTDNSRWQSTETQPCPDGYRIPTITDFMGIFTSSGVLVNTVTGPVTKTESLAGGSFTAHYWGDKSNTIYGIKKMGSPEAYFIKWEWLKTGGNNYYVKISRWDAGENASFSGKSLSEIADEFIVLGESVETISFPASGNIVGSSGSYSEGSPGGYYWTSSLNGNGAHRGEFTSGKMISGDTYNSRISGHSIRCVKD